MLGLLLTFFFAVVVVCLCYIFGTLQIPEQLLALLAEKLELVFKEVILYETGA